MTTNIEDRHDGQRGRCEWIGQGERCHYPGACSRDTHGRGPWYCREHIFCDDQVKGAEVVRSSRTWPHEDVRPEQERSRREEQEREAQERAGRAGAADGW